MVYVIGSLALDPSNQRRVVERVSSLTSLSCGSCCILDECAMPSPYEYILVSAGTTPLEPCSSIVLNFNSRTTTTV